MLRGYVTERLVCVIPPVIEGWIGFKLSYMYNRFSIYYVGDS